MKLSIQLIATVAFAATSAFAQVQEILTPSAGQQLTVGEPFTVQVAQPVSQGIFESVSVIIGQQNCGANACPTDDNDGVLGEILFAGDFNPQRHEVFSPPYQNFTFTAATAGHAVIHVVQTFLTGAGPSANLGTTNVSLTFAAPAAPESAKFRRGL
ncbi:hypothetical protein K439DRAFT_886183 [Ramaria rubella]|nr:hypothetical protein K439DRAFT_886183 [Ramaria rubella]